MQADAIPYGYCHCGCGERTRIATRNDPRSGEVKGQPVRFRKAHHHRGKIVSAETRIKLSAAKLGSGTSSGYRAIHAYLCALYPKRGICENCGATPARTVYALIHGREHARKRENYRELCERCHVRYDLGGKPLSAEHRAKLSAARKRAWEEGRYAHHPHASEKGSGITAEDILRHHEESEAGCPLPVKPSRAKPSRPVRTSQK